MGAEGGGKLLFATVAVAVADGMEARGVGHLGEMGKLVPHDIVAQLLRKKCDDIAQMNLAARRAFAKCTESAHDMP